MFHIWYRQVKMLYSSSITVLLYFEQYSQILFSLGTLFLLPVSIFNSCAEHLNLVKAERCLLQFIQSRYFSFSNNDLKNLKVLKFSVLFILPLHSWSFMSHSLCLNILMKWPSSPTDWVSQTWPKPDEHRIFYI